jgi:hypothetical protein
VAALPNGAEKTSLSQRLDVVQQLIIATNQVIAAETALSGFEHELQASDLSVPDSNMMEAELERLQTALQPVKDELAKANTLIAALPASDQPIVEQHITNLNKRSATAGGYINSIETIIEEAHKPMGQGNGNEEYRIQVTLGSTVSMLEEFEDAIVDQLLTSDGMKWLSFDRSKADIDSNGAMTAVKNGVVKVIGYNAQGIVTLIAVINNNS